jgi:hypothetical protein
VKAETERKKMAKTKPLPKQVLTLPEDAKDVERKPNRIEFKIGTGKVKGAVDAWRKQFASEGWTESVATLEDMAGSISFSKDNQEISVTYVATGILTAEVTLRASGVELEQTAEQK